MRIWDSEAVLIFLVLFVPGFISLTIYDLLVPNERRDFTKSIPAVVGYSALNNALFYLIYLQFPVTLPVNHPAVTTLFWLVGFIIAPILWPVLWLRVSKQPFLAKFISNPTPTPWDHIFSKRESFWLIVHLTDGRKIGGRYDTESYVTTYPKEPQIYMETVWRLGEDGAFLEEVDRSRGIVILGKEISLIEFFDDREMQNGLQNI